jgi:hypothetical protein
MLPENVKVLVTLQVYLKTRRPHDGMSYSRHLIDNSKFWEQENEVYCLWFSFDAMTIFQSKRPH